MKLLKSIFRLFGYKKSESTRSAWMSESTRPAWLIDLRARAKAKANLFAPSAWLIDLRARAKDEARAAEAALSDLLREEKRENEALSAYLFASYRPTGRETPLNDSQKAC